LRVTLKLFSFALVFLSLCYYKMYCIFSHTELFMLFLLMASLIRDNYASSGCPFKISSLTAKFQSGCSPETWQTLLSAKYDSRLPTQTQNTRGVTFPNEHCSLNLGREYGFLNDEEVKANLRMGSIMGDRMLKEGQYNPVAACEGAGMPNCCKFTEDSDGRFGFDSRECSDVLTTGANIQPLPNSYFSEIFKNETFTHHNYIFNTPSVTNPTHPSYRGAEFRRVGKQVHGKGQSCVEATFETVSNLNEVLPKGLRVGLFDKPGQQFSALVRFAGNKNFTVKDAHDIRIRSMAIKLRMVKGRHIRISGVNSKSQSETAQKAFNYYDFPPFEETKTVDLLNIAIRGPDTPNGIPFNTFVAPNSTAYTPGFLDGVPPAIPIDQITPFHFHPLNYTYGSAAALALGRGAAMKMHFTPCEGELEKLATISQDLQDPEFQFHNLKYSLEEGSFSFCVFIQLQENPCLEPVEDATIRWLTEPRLVAKLTLHQQTVYDYDFYCDNTVYHPYRTLVEHFPLGSIQRSRHPAYGFSQSYRLMINNGIMGDGSMGQTDPNRKRPEFSPVYRCTDTAYNPQL